MNSDQCTRRTSEGGSTNLRRGKLEDDRILASQGYRDGRPEAESRQQTPKPLRSLKDEVTLSPVV
jgi:hypothetical protein